MRNIKRIGVIGAGKHFKKNVYPVLKKSKSYKIISFLKHKKKNFEGHTFISEKEFFKEKLDFVYIATPNHLHDKYIIKSLEANFHVICEKPFVIKKKNIQKILNLSKYKKRLIFESFMYMYHPIFNEIKKIIESNKFGKLRYIISNWKHPSLNKKNNQYSKNLGEGFRFDGASYPISFDNFFFKKNKKMQIDSIKGNVDLRGCIFFNSQNVKRYYFWGEGQNYRNDLELFFSKATVYVEQFYAKRSNDVLSLKIHKDFKINEKKIENKNHFFLMFKNILNNYSSKKFQEYHRKKILNQSKYLLSGK
tara:strand:+ start:1387 stop:2304 length:918 start_codon:yes stop_codon:yes gene_type:complete